MRWVIVLGGWLVASGSWAEVPLDLDSPFQKIALIQEKSGEIDEKVVQKGKRNADMIEFEKEGGGLLVLPSHQVLAVLPRLPGANLAYLQSDVAKAIKVLEQAQAQFPQRPELQASTLQEWKVLGVKTTDYEKKEADALQAWLKKCGHLSSDVKPEELETMREKGVEFLKKFPDCSKEIERELIGLRELGAIDLTKADSIQFELGELGNKFVVGAVLWVLLIAPLVVILKVFPNVIRSFREGFLLAGILRFLAGVAALGLLAGLLLDSVKSKRGALDEGGFATTSARKAVWYTLNNKEKWATQNSKKINLPSNEWLAFFDAKVVEGSGADSFPYWHLGKPRIEAEGDAIILVQPLQAKIFTLPLCFFYSAPRPGQLLTGLEIARVYLGRIPLGVSVGEFVWQIVQPAYEPIAEKLGIPQGVRWMADEGGTITVEIPATKKPGPQAKESLSAKELAEVFDQGWGEIYFGKVISVEGSLVDVSSTRETLGAGTGLNVQDSMDEFILEGIPEGSDRRYALRVRCQFKSPEAYFLDAKGDLFKSTPTPQNPSSDIPILRRLDGRTRVRISAGRVESRPTETRLITLYDCRKVEGFDGKEWILIWGN